MTTINKKLDFIFSQEQEFPVSIVCSTNDQDKVKLMQEVLVSKDINNVIFIVPHYRARHIIAFHLSNISEKIVVAEDLLVEDLKALFSNVKQSETTLIIYDSLSLKEDIFKALVKTTWKEVVFVLSILNPSSESNRNPNDVSDLFNYPPW